MKHNEAGLIDASEAGTSSVPVAPLESPEQLVRTALHRVVDPCSIAAGAPVSILEMGLLRGVSIDDGRVTITLRLTNPFCFQAELIRARICAAVGQATGHDVVVDVDPSDDWEPEMMSAGARARLRAIRPSTGRRSGETR